MRRVLTVLTLGLALAWAVAGCGSDDAPSAGGSAETVVVDVRTPEEHAAGHLEGSLNIDLGADDFSVRIGELDPDGEYVVYCRTGNRSAQAVERMRDQGFTDVTDAGGLEQAAAATGLEVVTG